MHPFRLFDIYVKRDVTREFGQQKSRVETAVYDKTCKNNQKRIYIYFLPYYESIVNPFGFIFLYSFIGRINETPFLGCFLFVL